jgi:hypothetical protein
MALSSSARCVAARFGVCVSLGVDEGRSVRVAVGVCVAVAATLGDGSGVLVGVGWDVAQARETKKMTRKNDIKVYRNFRCICPPFEQDGANDIRFFPNRVRNNVICLPVFCCSKVTVVHKIQEEKPVSNGLQFKNLK